MYFFYKKNPFKGNKISHSNKKTKRRFYLNLKKKKLFSRKKRFFYKLKLPVKLIKFLKIA